MARLGRVQRSLERAIGNCFYNYGNFVARYYLAFLIVPIILAIVCGCGFLNFGEINDVFKQFTPTNSPSYKEKEVEMNFWEMEPVAKPTLVTPASTTAAPATTAQPKPVATIVQLPVVLEAKDGSNLLNRSVDPDSVDPVIAVLDFFEYDLTITHENRTYTYQDFCYHFCEFNNPIRLFFRSYNMESVRTSPNVRLSHPSMELFDVPVFTGKHIYGAHKDEEGDVGFIAMVQFIMILYKNQSSQDAIMKWQWAMYNYVTNSQHPEFRLYTTSEEAVQIDIQRTGRTSLPFFALGTLALLVFTVVSAVRSDCTRSKVWEALAGVIGPFLAILISFGSLIFFGLNYQPIVTVSLFLILSIGVDDVFIMLNGWHKSNFKASVPERLAEAMRHSGPSITITSLTNALSFAIGALTPTPAIRTFCIFTCAAVVADYVCQITYFPAVLALAGKREEAGCNSCVCCVRHQKPVTLAPITNLSRAYKKSLVFVADAATTWAAKILLLVLLMAYWSVSAYGCTTMQADLSIDRLLLPDSPFLKWSNLQKRFFDVESNEVVVIFQTPDHLANATKRQLAFEMVAEFESLPHYTEDSTYFWLISYMEYLSFYGDSFTYKYLPSYLTTSNHRQWRFDINYDHESCIKNRSTCLRRFKFHIDYHGFIDWPIRIKMVAIWRAIVAQPKYADLAPSLFYERSFMADQVASIGSITFTTVLVTMCCMTVVCILFVPSVMSIICAIGAVLSINIGVVGILMLWGVDLDPISMAGILMAVGFSVDYTAHITYHYSNNALQEPKEKLLHALKAVCWPETQAAVSTLLCASVLSFNRAYLVLTFVKTVTLVICLGWIHGMVVLPIVLTTITQISAWFSKEANN